MLVALTENNDIINIGFEKFVKQSVDPKIATYTLMIPECRRTCKCV